MTFPVWIKILHTVTLPAKHLYDNDKKTMKAFFKATSFYNFLYEEMRDVNCGQRVVTDVNNNKREAAEQSLFRMYYIFGIEA